jgi:hypothetical protein
VRPHQEVVGIVAKQLFEPTLDLQRRPIIAPVSFSEEFESSFFTANAPVFQLCRN